VYERAVKRSFQAYLKCRHHGPDDGNRMARFHIHTSLTRSSVLPFNQRPTSSWEF
jgi:hypothetical protein